MNIRDILGSAYSEYNYSIFVRDLLKNVSGVNNEINVNLQFANYIKSCKHIADFIDSTNKRIAILSIEVKDNSKARTIQRNYVAKILTDDLISYDAALVAYYDMVRTNWKLALVTIDYNMTDEGIKVSYQPAKRYSFWVGMGESSKTYLTQLKPLYDMTQPPTFEMLKEAFSISKITKDFYNDYCNCFEKLSIYLMQNRAFQNESIRLQYDEVKQFAITFTKKTLGQIVFLHFIQKKGWLGVEPGNEWGTGDKKYIYNSTRFYSGENYFNDVLEPLFYEALNKKRADDLYNGVKVPFLNGGLFSPVENYRWKDTNFDIPNDIWFNNEETGFLDILNQYNFTVDESDPTEQDIAVDPEMLGKIFESLLDPEERHDNGAHYTPREIVHFMCIESLAYNLSDKFNIDFSIMKNYILFGNTLENKSQIIQNADELLNYLKVIKIVDPAVGSGAFLVGMLNEILKLQCNLCELMNREYSKYEIKKETIQNSLYGVDIENDAIEIAKLRLWLSLIVDQEVEMNSTPSPLPNLAFQLRVGNSLVDEYHGVKLWDETLFKKKTKKNVYQGYNLFNVMDYDAIINNLKAAKESFFSISDEKEKNRLFAEISKFQLELIKNVLHNKNEMDVFYEVEEMIKKRTKPFFLWKLEFDKVFDEGGFDIVIANPPYIQLQLNGGKLANELEPQGFKTFTRMGDIYCLFYEQAINLLKDKATFAFITSNKWMRAGYGEKLRAFLSESTNPRMLLDFGGTRIFESATVDVNILIASKTKNTGETKTLYFNGNGTENLSVFIEQNKTYNSYLTKEIWTINSKIENSIKLKIENKGLKLGLWDVQILYGIKTGFNEAFVIDKQTRDRLVSNDSKSADIIRPILRGRDIKRYTFDSPNLYMICTFPSKRYDIDDYPEIKKHLLSFGIERLEQTGKIHNINGISVKSRKKTNNKWFETQDSISYSDEFYKQKIVFPCIMSSGPSFALDDKQHFLPAPGNIITGEHLEYLLGILCSKTYYYALRKFYMGGGIEGELKTNRLLLLPIPKYDNNKYATQIEDCVKRINENFEMYNNKIERIIQDMLSLSEEEYLTIINTKY